MSRKIYWVHQIHATRGSGPKSSLKTALTKDTKTAVVDRAVIIENLLIVVRRKTRRNMILSEFSNNDIIVDVA